MPYRLQELIDVSQLQAFLDSFSGVSGIPTAIMGRDGSVIASSGWSEICLAYHRAHPEALQCCIDSNARVVAELAETSGIFRYTCPHGFMKAAFALVVDREHLGTMVAGQVLLEPPDKEQFRERAGRYGFDEEQYLAALREVPVIAPQQLDRNLACLQKLTDLIVAMANGARREMAAARSSALLAQRYASILETTADGFWIIDSEGRCLEANAVCAANLGYSPDELRGMTLRDIDAGDSDEEMAERTAIMKRDGFGRFESFHRRKDGSLMAVEVSTSHIADEDIFIAFIRDISENKRAEASLRESEQRFRSLFESMQEGVALHEMIIDERGKPEDYRILDVNSAYTVITGIDRRKAVGALGSELYGTSTPPYLHEFSQPLLTGIPFNFETYFPPMGLHFRISVFSPAEGQFATVFTDITRSKQAEDNLRQSEERFRSLFQQAPVPYQSLDMSGNLLEVNNAWCQMMGYEPSEVIGTNMGTYLSEYARPLLQDRMSLIASSGFLSGVPCQLIRKDGTTVDVIVEGGVGYDSQGCFKQTHCILIDVTERKRTDDALRESEERFRLLYERAPMPYQSLGTEGQILDVNPAWLQMSGYLRDEVIGHPIADFLTSESVLLLKERFPRFLSTGAVHDAEFQFRCKDGEEKTVAVEGRIGYDVQGNFKQTHCMLYDVTEKKKAEEALQASQQRLQFLLTSTPAVIYTCRASGDFGATFISDNVRILMGYEPRDFLQDSGFWLEHIHPEDRPRVLEDIATLATHGHHIHEYRFRAKDGSYRWMHDELILVRGTDGIPLECVGCWMDVTQRREAEDEVHRLNEQLEQRVEERTAELAASNRELEAFCYSISHDLRAPLRAIDGCTKILQEDYEPRLDEAGKDLCTRIGSNAVRMGALIDDLLTFSRVGRASLELEQLDMSSLARMTFEELVPLEERQRIEFCLDRLPPAMADATTIGQVWANLLDNAVKYSSKQPDAVIKVTGRQEGDKLVYCVRDNGVGFDMAYSNKLFGVFLRAHSPAEFPGTGVGLAIVERIIHRHGGQVWAEGEVGKGASFYFSLPA
jgi:PAS domain S-box-containing protein